MESLAVTLLHNSLPPTAVSELGMVAAAHSFPDTKAGLSSDHRCHTNHRLQRMALHCITSEPPYSGCSRHLALDLRTVLAPVNAGRSVRAATALSRLLQTAAQWRAQPVSGLRGGRLDRGPLCPVARSPPH